MIDFGKKVEINKRADETLKTILSKKQDNFEQFQEVRKIDDLEVAKVIIKRLLEKVVD